MDVLDPGSKIKIHVIYLRDRVNNYWILELHPKTVLRINDAYAKVSRSI